MEKGFKEMKNCKNDNYAILFVSRSIYNKEQFYATLTGKIFLELGKHIKVTSTLYNPYLDIEKNEVVDDLFVERTVPCKHQGIIGRLRNMVYILCNNIKVIKSGKYDLIWIPGTAAKVNMLCFYRLLCPQIKFAIQMFTPSVNRGRIKRKILNSILQFNLIFYKNLLVTKHWRQDKLFLPSKKMIEIEVGYPDYGFAEREKDNLRLLYVGTLSGRDIEKTVYGLKKVIEERKIQDISYDIIGSGNRLAIQKVINAIIETELSEVVTYHGFLSVEDLAAIMKKCNVGVSFVPLDSRYGYSSTKTLEYLIAGMPVIATDNEVRRKFINSKTGVLCQDTVDSFASAVYEMYLNKDKYDSKAIRETHLQYSIGETIKHSYLPKLLNLIRGT